MSATIHWVFLTALRDRLFGGVLVMLALATGISMGLAVSALTEQMEMAMSFAAGAGRFILVLGLTIFIAFHVQRMFETREIEAVLSRALSRTKFILAYWIGFSVLAVFLAAIFAALILVFAGAGPGPLLWAGTLMAECIIVVAVAIFAGLMLERATSTVLFTVGFYALSRLSGFFIAVRKNIAEDGSEAINRVLDVITLFIPRLDLFAQTKWLVYAPAPSEMSFAGAQALLFLALILSAAMYDLSRKEF